MKPVLECGFYSHDTVQDQSSFWYWKILQFSLVRKLLSEVDHIQFPLFMVGLLIILPFKTCAEPVHAFLIYRSSYVYQFCHIWTLLLTWLHAYQHHCAFQYFCHVFYKSFLSHDRRDWMAVTHLERVMQFFHSIYCPDMGLCIWPRLLSRRASMITVEQYTDLCV